MWPPEGKFTFPEATFTPPPRKQYSTQNAENTEVIKGLIFPLLIFRSARSLIHRPPARRLAHPAGGPAAAPSAGGAAEGSRSRCHCYDGASSAHGHCLRNVYTLRNAYGIVDFWHVPELRGKGVGNCKPGVLVADIQAWAAITDSSGGPQG